MNPLLIFGGLGILSFALMGMKKKSTSSTFIPHGPDVVPMPMPTPTPRPWEPSPSDSDDPWRIASVPGFQIPGRVA